MADGNHVPQLLTLIEHLAGLSGTAVIIFVCWLVGKGHLIHRRELDREKADCAAQRIMADFWRAKAEDWQAKALDAWNVTDRAVSLADRASETTAKVVSNDKAEKEHRPRQGR